MSTTFIEEIKNISPNIHTLKNGVTIIVLMPGEGFRFSDGSYCGAQKNDILNEFKAPYKISAIFTIKEIPIIESYYDLPYSKTMILKKIASMANVVITTELVINCLKRMNIRDKFPNVVIAEPTPTPTSTSKSKIENRVLNIEYFVY